jgi:hypothetical protein
MESTVPVRAQNNCEFTKIGCRFEIKSFVEVSGKVKLRTEVKLGRQSEMVDKVKLHERI